MEEIRCPAQILDHHPTRNTIKTEKSTYTLWTKCRKYKGNDIEGQLNKNTTFTHTSGRIRALQAWTILRQTTPTRWREKHIPEDRVQKQHSMLGQVINERISVHIIILTNEIVNWVFFSKVLDIFWPLKCCQNTSRWSEALPETLYSIWGTHNKKVRWRALQADLPFFQHQSIWEKWLLTVV